MAARDIDDEPPEDDFENEPEPEPARGSATLSAAEVVQTGLRHIAGLTGKEVVGVTSVKPAEDGWLVEVEAVEDRRIPSSSDLLAIYEAQVASDGSLLAYRRKKRYARGRGDNGNGS